MKFCARECEGLNTSASLLWPGTSSPPTPPRLPALCHGQLFTRVVNSIERTPFMTKLSTCSYIRSCAREKSEILPASSCHWLRNNDSNPSTCQSFCGGSRETPTLEGNTRHARATLIPQPALSTNLKLSKPCRKGGYFWLAALASPRSVTCALMECFRHRQTAAAAASIGILPVSHLCVSHISPLRQQPPHHDFFLHNRIHILHSIIAPTITQFQKEGNDDDHAQWCRWWWNRSSYRRERSTTATRITCFTLSNKSLFSFILI